VKTCDTYQKEKLTRIRPKESPQISNTLLNTNDKIDLSGICNSENYLNKLFEIPSRQEELIHKKNEKVKTRVENGIILFSQ
jgi:hypothetical protein